MVDAPSPPVDLDPMIALPEEFPNTHDNCESAELTWGMPTGDRLAQMPRVALISLGSQGRSCGR